MPPDSRTFRPAQVQKVVRGAVASSGANWSSKLVAEAVGVDLESARTLMTAAFDRVKDLAGEAECVDAVWKAMGCSSKAEMTRWILQGDGEVLKEVMAEYPAVLIQAQKMGSSMMMERRGSKFLSRKDSKLGGDLVTPSHGRPSYKSEGDEGWGVRQLAHRGSCSSSMHEGEGDKLPAYVQGQGGEGGADDVLFLERKQGRVAVQHRETQSEAGQDKGVGTEGDLARTLSK